ncbi:MAG: cob(I)yrinic acid a,c-diamide adenosyltransferase [Azoarcus sp.]|jgi:cob(I)alamin adenosyltransferase|nr:cob(I)yrinic acid a,c-diamide adenosyltransferase [Azoarcus sp.]
MGHRITKIYTRTGDAGQTGLGDGRRVAKSDPRIRAIGEIDETNAALGVLLAEELPDDMRALLTDVQHDMFDLGGEICIPGMCRMTAQHVERLEKAIDAYNADLPPLKNFILPGGSRAAALAHHARAICRRAERTLVALAQAETVNDGARQYLNRLSDLLFVLGRALNRVAGYEDVLWEKKKNAGEEQSKRAEAP